ncbi:MAG: DUF3177 family protein [Aphanocapsa sp. GSE-SYN-MK-11-07L]|jgi:hypothetical protein|nr:DUF3177 family protein [Aphanocapsa sp. GSE-SYN-MK-11-07L]
MSIEVLRSLVWADYRLAILFAVILPLGLLLWAVIQNAEPIVRLLIIYWRVSSLLAITVYLLVAQMPVGFLTGLATLMFIPVGLWFWIDLNEEIADRPGPLQLAFTSWRWGITLYCALAAIGQVMFINCAFVAGAIATPSCQVWLEAPLLFQQIFHANAKVSTLGFLASGALIVYVCYLAYFVFFRLSKQGRSATGL